VNSALRRVVQSLRRAEADINLLARCQPINVEQLQRDIRSQWFAGRSIEPLLEFAPPPDLSQLRGALEDLGVWLESGERWAKILAERTRELLLEAQMVESVGTASIVHLAKLRFHGAQDSQAHALRRLAQKWATLTSELPDAATVSSDDERSENSLLQLVRTELARLGIPFPVRLNSKMMARAAVDDTAVWVKPGVYLAPRIAKRIAVHEVHGHAVPRFNARRAENWLIRCAVVHADVDEEGRALLFEERAGYLDSTRKRELGLRHLAADACRHGASFRDTVRLLIEYESSLDDLLPMVLRVWRGGGLAREIIYMTGYFKATRVLRTAPNIDDWMQRGRLSFDVSRELERGQLSLADEG